MDSRKNRKKERGEQGYLAYKKRSALYHTLSMVGIGLLIFFVGLLLNKMEPTNVFSIAAILMVLPAAKSFVTVIILFPYRPMPKEQAEAFAALAGQGDVVLYDVVFTSAEKVMHLDCMYVTDHQILGITSREKDDIKAVQAYLEKELKLRKLSYVVFLTKEESALKKRMALRSQKPEKQASEKNEQEEVLEMLRVFTV